MEAKKVTFKHFENKKIKSREVKTIDGIFKYPPLYFRVTYNRKTSAYNSYFFFDVIKIFLHPKKYSLLQSPFKKAELEKHWNSIVKTIKEKDSEFIEIVIKYVIEKYGIFDFKYFKKIYYDSYHNFLIPLDYKILKGLIMSLNNFGLDSTREFLEDYVSKNPFNWSGMGNSATYYHPNVLKMFEELKQNNVDSIINNPTLQLIRIFKTLSNRFILNLADIDIGFAYLPIVYLTSEAGKKELSQIFESEFSINQIYDFMNVVNEILIELK